MSRPDHVVFGGTGDDRIYADARLTVEQAIYNGNHAANLAVRGDALSGARIKGVSFEYFLDQPCHVAHALN